MIEGSNRKRAIRRRKVTRHIANTMFAAVLVVGLMPVGAFAFAWDGASVSHARPASAGIVGRDDALLPGAGVRVYALQNDSMPGEAELPTGDGSHYDFDMDDGGSAAATEPGDDQGQQSQAGSQPDEGDAGSGMTDEQAIGGDDEVDQTDADEGDDSPAGDGEEGVGQAGMTDEEGSASDAEDAQSGAIPADSGAFGEGGDVAADDMPDTGENEDETALEQAGPDDEGVFDGEGPGFEEPLEDTDGTGAQEALDESEIAVAEELDEDDQAEDVEALKERISAAVLSVMADPSMTTTVKKTELRNKASRVSSAIPAEDIIIDDKGRLDLAKATLTNNGVPGLEYATKMGRYVGDTHEMKGIWIDNPKTLSGTEISVLPGSFSLRWPDCAEDSDGNRLGVTVTVSKIMLRHASDLGNYSDHIMIMSNINSNTNDTSGDYLHLDSVMEALKSTSSVPKEHWDKAPNCGVRMTVSIKFTKVNSTAKAKGTYLFMMTDLDQPDATYNYKYLKEDSEARFTESVQLLNGFDSTVYLQKDIPGPASAANPDPGASLLYAQNDIARFSGTADSKYGSEYRAGLVAKSDSEFSFNWWGSHAATSILSRYDGVVIRDKNDPTDDTTDKAIITKTTDAFGLKSSDENAAFNGDTNHGGQRTSAKWRSTDMPWKGNAVYHFSAQKGYRVSKVEVSYGEGDSVKTDSYAGSDLKGLTELSFGNADCDYACVQNYDIVVTTIAIAPGSAAIGALKQLEGRELADSEFTFELFDDKGVKLEEAKNKKDGTVTFSSREFSAKDIGTHSFKIREVIPDDAQAQLADGSFVTYAKASEAQRISKELVWMKDYLVYDNTSRAVSVEVSDAGGSALVCSVSYDGDAEPSAFRNEQKEEPKKYGGVRVKKVDASSGEGLAGAQFTVESSDGETYTMESNDAGLAELPATALLEGTYTVRETRPPEGYSLNEEWQRAFSIERDGQVVDLTDDPCKNSEVPKVELPVTGAAGISTLAFACVAMVAAGTFLRRKGFASR